MTTPTRNQRWTIERVVPLLGGTLVLVSLVLGNTHSSRWRMLTGLVGANLALYGTVGWCPMSLLMAKMGLRRQNDPTQ